ncbi:hypothetical protein HDU81_002505 [Chytriomyces hyalinus]|nr:hypothetical protein HDU81_002505 [Chytriomyces hyalinus]
MLRESVLVTAFSGVQLQPLWKGATTFVAAALGFKEPIWLVAVFSLVGFATSLYALVSGFASESPVEELNDKATLFVAPSGLGIGGQGERVKRGRVVQAIAVIEQVKDTEPIKELVEKKDKLEEAEPVAYVPTVRRSKASYSVSATQQDELVQTPAPLQTVRRRLNRAAAPYKWPPANQASNWGASIAAPVFMDPRSI